jgi:hypothetical protein
MYYVYIYLNILRPGNYTYQNLHFYYEPFYVGKGKDKRYLYHLEKVKNKCKYKRSDKFEIIESIVNSGNEPIIIKYDNLSEDDALFLEKETITKIGRFDLGKGPLSNRNDGGHKPQDNYHHDLESKKKISIASKNREAENRYTLISNDGIIYDNIKLSEMCIKFNLDYQKIRKYANKGKVKEIKSTSIKQSKQSTINCVGWELINKKIIKKEVKLPKYKLISPDGLEHFIYSDTFISDKCSELNLDQRTLRYYKNKGIINIKNITLCNEKTINCIGWQFIVLQYP